MHPPDKFPDPAAYFTSGLPHNVIQPKYISLEKPLEILGRRRDLMDVKKLAHQADIAPPGGDGVVNVQDLLAVIAAWGACPGKCPPSCAGDIAPAGGDCTVNVQDLLFVIGNWG